MRSQAADRVLGDVHRRLQLQRNADAMRRAAWLTFVVTGIAVTLHFLVRPVAPVEVVVAVVAVWSIAVVGARLPTIDRRECAAWADRHLDGACAFETYLERRDGPALPPGVEHQFADSLEQLSRGAADRLRALPVASNLRRPLALAAVGLLLAVVLLQVPVQVRTAGREGVEPRVTAAPPAASASPASPASGGDESPTRARPPAPEPNPATQGAMTRRRSATGGDPAGRSDEAAVDRESASSNGGATAKRPGTGGQEAGDTADTAENPSLSEAWTGAMAAQYRALAAPPEAATRADPTLAATYSQDDASHTKAFAEETAHPAAAVPPPARHASSPGPAERAYVRAYQSLQGATP